MDELHYYLAMVQKEFPTNRTDILPRQRPVTASVNTAKDCLPKFGIWDKLLDFGRYENVSNAAGRDTARHPGDHG